MKKLPTLGTIELNSLFLRALDLMENSNRNIFITGRAGTGKSTLLEYFRAKTKKKVVVLAPTGVAAVNVAGETIHSFFRFKPDITMEKIKRKSNKSNSKSIYHKIDAIIIDEISMVRADLLDCVDKFLRLNGKNEKIVFGGIQMIFIGDLYQLPPVVTPQEQEIFRGYYQSPYFFDAHLFSKLEMDFIELEKIYRQKDQRFIKLLNAIRNKTITLQDIAKFNEKFDPNFEIKNDDFYITLTTTNQMAKELNEIELKKIKTKLYQFQGSINGKFDLKNLPTDIELQLKVGAQVMMLNNDKQGRWVNGTMAKVADIKQHKQTGEDIIIVEKIDGNIVEVTVNTWEIFHYQYNQAIGRLETEIIGTFTQYPLKLAWAITIHKSQGKTFDRVIIDMGRGAFAHGQTYVALSRCRTLSGIILKKPLKLSHVWLDWRIVKFITNFQYQKSQIECSLDKKIDLIKEAIKNKTKLQITYLKAQDVKSKRVIMPKYVGEMEYLEKTYLGVEAHCYMRNEDRVFRVDRILEIDRVSE